MVGGLGPSLSVPGIGFHLRSFRPVRVPGAAQTSMLSHKHLPDFTTAAGGKTENKKARYQRYPGAESG